MCKVIADQAHVWGSPRRRVIRNKTSRECHCFGPMRDPQVTSYLTQQNTVEEVKDEQNRFTPAAVSSRQRKV